MELGRRLSGTGICNATFSGICDATFSGIWNETLLDDRGGGGAATWFAAAAVVAAATAASSCWMSFSIGVNGEGSELHSGAALN